MRLVVDLNRCQGYGQCAFAAPEVFEMRGDEGLLYVPNPGDEQREKVLRAAAACPVRAIVLDRGPGKPAAAARVQAARPSDQVERIVIVGASLAGLRAAHALRREGFAGSLTLIGDEPYEPYDRIPLSKHVLTGRVPAQRTALPLASGLDADWRLGQAAVGLDGRNKQVLVADGEQVAYDRLLIATGVRAEPWPNADEAALDGVHTVRGRDDAAALRQRLATDPGHVLVIGAGFIGSEVASDCRELGLPVTVVDRGPTPLAGALGAVVGRIAAQMQQDAGVDLRSRTSVSALEADADGRLRRARLSDGSTLDVEVAVAALGSRRNVEWLEGSGVAAGRWGVACDAGCRAFDAAGVVTDDIFVAGDVARFPHPAYNYEFMALEHWGNAVDQAEIAAHNMISAGPDRWAHLTLPVFWSTQFGTEIKSIGVPTYADEIVLTQGSPADRRFVAAYGRQGRITAAVTFDHGMWLEFYGRLIEQAAPFPPTMRTVDQAPTRQPLPAETREAPAVQATVVLTGHQPSERRAVLVHGG
ncbi:FAD-dependent oxidoreductase [Actinopolymorpha sp. B11F2]|uniref:FAD-dependent oxidoreductase n=1 Tax=Actinopolymorpha sp. B11F2 TaxID=3160862 RepID=UPI0032E519A7